MIDPTNQYQAFVKISPSFSKTEIKKNTIKVNAGVLSSQLINIAMQNNLSGLEFFAGVPATIGGMVAMNYGCWGKQISDIIQKVHIATPDSKTKWLHVSDCHFEYRSSPFLNNKTIILEVILNLCPEKSQKIKQTVESYLEKRKNEQPISKRTFGSIFKNPKNQSAGKMIESLGYKGKTFQGVKISQKHANFMINNGQAKFLDAVNCIKTIQNDINTQLNIQLKPEVQIVQ